MRKHHPEHLEAAELSRMPFFLMPLPQKSHTIQIRLEAASPRKVDFCLNMSQCGVCLLRISKKNWIVHSIFDRIFRDLDDPAVRLLHEPLKSPNTGLWTISEVMSQLADISRWCMHSDDTCSQTPHGLLSEFACSLEMWFVFHSCF